MNNVAAVVVTYNRIQMLKENLEALQKQSYPCDVLVVDNHSVDETQEYMNAYIQNHPNMQYIRLSENTGGAGGFNRGFREAALKGYDYVWVMDDDCIPNVDALETLMDADKQLKGEYGYLSSVVLWTDGKECKMNRQKVKKAYYEYAHLLKDSLVQVEQSTFVSLLFPMATIKKVGLPIKEFFIWGDDIEYTRRITVRNRMPSFLVGTSHVTHKMKENTGSSISIDRAERISRYSYAFRNENYLYRQEGLKGVCYYTAKCGLNALRIIKNAPDHKSKRLSVLLKAMLKGLLFNPNVEYLP